MIGVGAYLQITPGQKINVIHINRIILNVLQRFLIVNSVSCLDSFLLECPPAVKEVGGSNHGREMSVSGALVEDGENSGQVFPQ
jgi:hypothetical protein